MNHPNSGTNATAWFNLLAACTSVLLLGVGVWIVIEYRDAPLLGRYAFRETQTALTSYWICQEGFRLAYLTPVGGRPWSIPFEFPIYQWLVSLIGCRNGSSLDPFGRLISFGFFVASLWPARLICKRIFANQASLYFWTFVALFLSAPIYLHYGHAFLPESAALFFTLGYLAFSLEMSLGPDRWKQTILTALFLTLALLQKATTALPLLVFGVVYLWSMREELLLDRFKSRTARKFALAYIAPLIVGLAWVKYTDHVKTASPFGTWLTSGALSSWNFGTFSARYSRELWLDVIWHRVIGDNLAGHLGVLLIFAGIVLAPKRRLVISVGVLLFLLFFMVFENLHFVHEYYPFSNTVYLILAAAVATGGLVEAKPRLAIFPALTFLCIIAVNLNTYFSGHLFAEEKIPVDETQPVLATAKFVREHTSSTAPILIYGVDWSSEVPYYAQRKAFAVPPWFKPYLEPLDMPEKYLAGDPGAVLICDEARKDEAVVGKVLSNFPTRSKTSLEKCDVYLRSG